MSQRNHQKVELEERGSEKCSPGAMQWHLLGALDCAVLGQKCADPFFCCGTSPALKVFTTVGHADGNVHVLVSRYPSVGVYHCAEMALMVVLDKKNRCASGMPELKARSKDSENFFFVQDGKKCCQQQRRHVAVTNR